MTTCTHTPEGRDMSFFPQLLRNKYKISDRTITPRKHSRRRQGPIGSRQVQPTSRPPSRVYVRPKQGAPVNRLPRSRCSSVFDFCFSINGYFIKMWKDFSNPSLFCNTVVNTAITAVLLSAAVYPLLGTLLPLTLGVDHCCSRGSESELSRESSSKSGLSLNIEPGDTRERESYAPN